MKAKKTEKPIVRITDTTLRDAHQSLWATRMRTEDILSVIDTVDAAGYYSLECWGGATFDVCLRFLREDPWERLRLIKSHCRTPLQMLLRGQNILGYKHYPDDVLRRFIELSAKNGIDIFRVFDALNDTRNLEVAIRTVKEVGAHAQGTISYTFSPVHTEKAYVKLASELEQLGADSICIKDMAGILSPGVAESLVRAITEKVSIPVQLHGHMTSGMAVATYLAGVRAGAGACDACVPSMSGCSSQPPVNTLCAVFGSYGIGTTLDLDAVAKEDEYFKSIRPSREPLKASGQFVDAGVLRHHIPGGMISNLRSQLDQQGALDRLDEVLEELPRVRADMGYPPLVTPTSQIIGIQSVLNVLGGKRYGMVTEETRRYVLGYYGRSPAKINPDVAKTILKGEKPITCRPADLLKPGLEEAAARLDPKLATNEEDILSYCLFPEVALGYFEWRATPEDKRPPIPADLERTAAAQQSDHQTTKPPNHPATKPTSAAPADSITAPLAGTFYRRPAAGKPDYAKEGDVVEAGTVICSVEAMKLMNDIAAPCKCKVVKFLAEHDAAVAKGQPLVEIKRV
ncbi:MAG: pyruvate carboxylase subunit B [Kiritimatiellae bacterium]|nr:pyruvate carboxylase subunit B [Kiritimatiellia bacterium]